MANRKQRRAQSKQQRRERRIIQESVSPIRQKCRDDAMKDFYEKVMPVFILYLIEHFHCKNDGVLKFMTWFNEMQEWLESNEEGFDEIQKILWERAGTKIVY